MLSLLSSPGAFVTGASAQVFCDDNVPEEWKRPGGYCDQLKLPGNDGWSIIEKSGGAAIVVPPKKDDEEEEDPCDWDWEWEWSETSVDLNRRIEDMEPGDRIHVADIDCPTPM
jgi:hypothetical protein